MLTLKLMSSLITQNGYRYIYDGNGQLVVKIDEASGARSIYLGSYAEVTYTAAAAATPTASATLSPTASRTPVPSRTSTLTPTRSQTPTQFSLFLDKIEHIFYTVSAYIPAISPARAVPETNLKKKNEENEYSL